MSTLVWVALADGARTARIEIGAPGAKGLRVALALAHAHPDLTLRFAGNGAEGQVFGPLPATAVVEATDRHGVYLTPVLEGDTAIIELEAELPNLSGRISEPMIEITTASAPITSEFAATVSGEIGRNRS